MSKHLDFIVDVVDGYLDAYNQIVKKRSITKYSQIQKNFNSTAGVDMLNLIFCMTEEPLLVSNQEVGQNQY